MTRPGNILANIVQKFTSRRSRLGKNNEMNLEDIIKLSDWSNPAQNINSCTLKHGLE
jgi:hypothetical protein